jgi:hypothetical protein
MHGSSRTRRLFKKAVQQGRSERRGESYFVPYVEPLSDARTMLAGFFISLLATSTDEAIRRMIVHQSSRLHVGIDDGAADKPKATLLEILR